MDRARARASQIYRVVRPEPDSLLLDIKEGESATGCKRISFRSLSSEPVFRRDSKQNIPFLGEILLLPDYFSN
jgi:hypothetical protein